jgi:hypothetical protein
MAGQTVDLQYLFEESNQLAREISSLHDSWSSQKTTHDARIREAKQFVFATSTRETSNVTNDHDHSTNIPKITQIYDSLKANYGSALMPHDHWFKFEGQDTKSVNKETRRKLEAYLRTKHRQNGLEAVADELLDDWVLEGNCFAGVYFTNKSATGSNGVSTQGYKGPMVYRISPNDIVFNPLSINFDSAPKIIRSVLSLGELARKIKERPGDEYLSEVFDKLVYVRQKVNGYTIDDINKSTQYVMDGYGSYGEYLKSNHVEILDFYGDIFNIETGEFFPSHVISVVDRRWVIRSVPIDTWNGHPMIFHSGWRKRPDNVWCMSPLENIVGMQYKINHLENAKADAFDKMLMPDRVIIGDVAEIVQSEDGSITYHIDSERGDVKDLAPDTTVLNADFQISNYMRMMEEMVGAPREAAGFRTPGEKTKYEVSKLLTAADRMFQYKLEQFEVQMLQKILSAEVEVSRKYLVQVGPDTVEMEDPQTGAKEFIEFTADDLEVVGSLLPVGSHYYSRKMQLIANLETLHNLPLKDPEVAIHFPAEKLAKLWEELMEFDDFELVTLYGRIAERKDAQSRMKAAKDQLDSEDAANVGDNTGAGQ